MTLIVVTETPVAWHDTEAFVGETEVRTPGHDILSVRGAF